MRSRLVSPNSIAAVDISEVRNVKNSMSRKNLVHRRLRPPQNQLEGEPSEPESTSSSEPDLSDRERIVLAISMEIVVSDIAPSPKDRVSFVNELHVQHLDFSEPRDVFGATSGHDSHPILQAVLRIHRVELALQNSFS